MQARICQDKGVCVDVDECNEEEYDDEFLGPCGENANCFNMEGSFYCQCKKGFRTLTNSVNFTAASSETCSDIHECSEEKGICGPNSACVNTVGDYICFCENGFASSGKAEFRKSDNVFCTEICEKNATCKNSEGSYSCVCDEGFVMSLSGNREQCEDVDECLEKDICGKNATCKNSEGSYSCVCDEGFEMSLSGNREQCKAINECLKENICGKNGTCVNSDGSYSCVCDEGFVLSLSGNRKQCEDICVINNTICGNGTCHHGDSGHYCACHSGFSNYGNVQARCTALKCEVLGNKTSAEKDFSPAYDLMMEVTNKCKQTAESQTSSILNGDELLEKLLSVIDQVLSGQSFHCKRKVSTFLDTVEGILGLIAPFTTPPGQKKSFNLTDLELHLHKGSNMPQGKVTLSMPDTKLDIQMETVAGASSQYPDFAAVALLSYRGLENATNGFFEGVKKEDKEKIEINSRIVTITVTNQNTNQLEEPVLITLNHLKQLNRSTRCVFWDSSINGGAWSTRGCQVKESNPNYTVCACHHLSSFAVLMALTDVEDIFELKLITWVGLSLSLICLFICILTFGLIRSIQSPRNKIHLHLCISLFLAYAIFLIGISRTENKVGCAVFAGLLHFFFLASFCWMCLEGIQLFRMVVLVFNASFRTVYLMAAGYGVPAVIVSISALANAKGYGTERYCWLNLDSIWTFFGPVCIILFVNIIFFLITVWKLAQKFSSLNPDLDKLQKIKTFTITAVAQLCLLGIMWIFGCFQFEEKSITMSYLFTIFASLQGVFLFVMHCLCSKQVRDEYRNILSRCCAPQKKAYSEFGYTHSSKTTGSKSTHDTGESNM
ncbi:hypothetical protein WMY93_003770 [Mugilogobius chulae]|uniref:Uncharacterized protein n=1 Tax=Mugilogobius chulae TaxID=88201 RepID=A0AAW0Q0K5_9GOBI